ncbi:MAG: gamma-glutamylcyclotransferase [Planctomycetota bacterium]
MTPHDPDPDGGDSARQRRDPGAPDSPDLPDPPDLPDLPGDLLDLLRAVAAARAAGRTHDDEPRLEQAHAASTRLAVYGTLAPGEPNHHHVRGLGGRWFPGEVRGWRAQRAYPVFTWDEAAPPVPVQVLEAVALPARWAQLDAFEGADYVRVLVPVRTADGRTRVANLYQARAPVAQPVAQPVAPPPTTPPTPQSGAGQSS